MHNHRHHHHQNNQWGYLPPIQPHSWNHPESHEVMRKSPEEQEMERQKELAKIEAEKRAQNLKESKWTQEDLNAILHSGQYKMLNGADITKIGEIMNGEIVLDKKNIGTPGELEDDLGRIEGLFTRNDLVVIKNGKPEKKEKMPPQFIDAVYGAVLTAHILTQGFYITTENRQPVLHDNQRPERTDMMKSLQEVLQRREWQGDSFHTASRDRSIIIPKIDTYIASAAFLSQGGKDLKSYRSELESKITTPGEAIGIDDIKNSSLEAGEKSFLIGFLDRSNDLALEQIQERQKAGVLEIENNPLFKTPEAKIAQFADNPSKLIMPTVFGLAAIGLLAIGLKMFAGKDSKWWQRILGIFVIGGGVAFGAPVVNGLLKETGLPQKVRQAVNGTPVIRESSPFPEKKIDTEDMKSRINRLSARLSGPDEWEKIIMNPEIGDEIATYPVGAMLAALNPPPDQTYKDYNLDTPTMDKIRATVGKLPTNTGEREQLNQLLKQSFERHEELHPGMDLADRRKLTLGETITSLDTADSWLNYIPEWIGGTDKKIEALKIMAPKAKEWGDISLEKLSNYFIEDQEDDTIRELISGPNQTNEAHKIIKEYVSGLDMNYKHLPLKEYLQKN